MKRRHGARDRRIALQTGRLDAFFCHFQLNSTHILGQDALHTDSHLESASMRLGPALREVASGCGILILAISILYRDDMQLYEVTPRMLDGADHTPHHREP
jgi:hypothetical protein